MTPQKIFEILIAETYTERMFRRQVAALQTFLEMKLFANQNTGSLEETLVSFFALHKELGDLEQLFKSRGQAFYDVFTAGNMYDILGTLNELFESVPVITLYLPTVLPREQLVEIGKWLREHVNPLTVMHVTVESSLGAGCAFVWKGVYHDFSLRYFMKKHELELRNLIREHANSS
jgi:hypothetical protein